MTDVQTTRLAINTIWTRSIDAAQAVNVNRPQL